MRSAVRFSEQRILKRPALRPAATGRFARKRAVDGNGARAPDDDRNGQGQREQVIFVSLTLLGAGPVHKESYMHVHHQHSDEHVHGDAESGDACQESKVSPRLPKNSAQIARKASGAGMCICVVKNPMVAEKP